MLYKPTRPIRFYKPDRSKKDARQKQNSPCVDTESHAILAKSSGNIKRFLPVQEWISSF